MTPWVFALVDFGIGISKLDRDVALKFILEPDRVDTGECFDHCGLAVRHVSNGANVDGRLPRDYLRGEGGQLCFLQS